MQVALCAGPMLSTAADSAAPVEIGEARAARVTRPSGDAVPTLAFAEFYKRPIGPRGLEPTPGLLALAGSRVQLSGFVARGAEPLPALAILAPTPVALGDEDEGLADDLPASVAYVHWTDSHIAAAIAACRNAMRVIGRLELGRSREIDGRMSFVRLLADDVQCAR